MHLGFGLTLGSDDLPLSLSLLCIYIYEDIIVRNRKKIGCIGSGEGL